MSDGTLEVGSCRLFKSDLFLTVLLVHFSMICISYRPHMPWCLYIYIYICAVKYSKEIWFWPYTIHSFNFPIYRLKQGYVGLGKEKPIVQCNIYGEIFVFIIEYKMIPVNAILQFIYL